MNADERIGRLERANRRLSLTVLGMFLASGVAGLTGATGSRYLEARAIRVVDEDGIERVSIGTENGMSYISVGRGDDGDQICLSVDPDGPAIVSLNHEGSKETVAMMMDSGVPELFVGSPRTGTSVTKSGIKRGAR